jgi:hypothetical protein
VAVDVAARAAESALSTPLARLAAVPARFVLAGIVGVSFAVRLLAALSHATPLYFPDEYIYAALSRSLAESGRPLIRGASASFPALLEPLLAAPFWLAGDPMLAYRLTQGLNALAMSLAAIPVYLLCRRLGLGSKFSLGAAAIAVASPNLLYASFVLADPIAYPLVLGALCAGVHALARPARGSQLAFVALAGLATFARVQYVILPVAFAGAALLLERRRVLRAHWLPLALFAAPVAVALALGPGRLLGYYSGVAHLDVELGDVVHWAGVDAMMLAYSAGWVLVPGALLGLALALARPRFAAERAFALLALLFAAGLFLEASLYAASGSTRYQERYLLTLLPLVAPAFGLFVARARPRRLALLPIAAGLVLLSVLVPLSGFTAAENKQDSPLLFAVFRLESAIGTADGALAVAIAAALLSALAVAIGGTRAGAALAFAVTIGIGAVASAAAFDFDAKNARNVRAAHLPGDLRWIDNSGLRSVVLVQTPGAPKGRALEQLFWNTSVTSVVVMKGAHPTDAFGAEPVRVADDGRLLVDERPLRRPLLIENYGVQVQLAAAERVASGASFDLWRPRGTPRFSLLVSGSYADGWLARTGSVTVWPDASGRARGTLVLRLSLPAGTERTPMRFQAAGVDRVVRVSPGGGERVVFGFESRGPWRLVWQTPKNGFLADGRAISVRAAPPRLLRTSTRLRRLA